MGLWDELGIAPTEDRAAIRRAYAARLKATRPEDDPDGFRRLRSAYEAALAGSAWVAPAPPPAPEPPLEPAPPPEPAARPEPRSPAAPVPPPAPPRPSAPPPPASEPSRRIEAALARRDVAGAAAELAASRGSDAMSLAEEMNLSDRLLLTLVHDRALPGPAVVEAATSLGWFGAQAAPNRSPLLNRLHARIEAEQWLARLQDRAHSWRFFCGSQRAAASRLLLGRGKARFAALLPPEPPLRRTLAEFHLHQGWIADRLDPARIEAVERIAARRYTRYAARLWLWAMLLPIMVVGAAKGAGVAIIIFWWVSSWLRAYARPVILAVTLSTLLVLLATWLQS